MRYDGRMERGPEIECQVLPSDAQEFSVILNRLVFHLSGVCAPHIVVGGRRI